MKPINDNELRDIISRKIASVPSVETDHLWAGVESGLSSSSSGYMTGILKCVLFVSSFISVVTISDSSGFAQEPNEQQIECIESSESSVIQLTTLDLPEESVIIDVKSADNSSTPGRYDGMYQTNPPKIQSQPNPAATSSKPLERPVASNVEAIKTNNLLLAEAAKGEVGHVVPMEEFSINRKNQFYIALSPYLTFHSMSPHVFDEHYITSSASSRVALMDRAGVQLSYGFVKVLSDRWVLNGSIGMDYYRTQFAYRIANNIDSEVLLSNHRVDGGLGIGIGYHINTPVGPGMIMGEAWARHKVHSFGASTYDPMIAGYRFSYLLDYKGLKIGPTYGSFFTSLSNEMGQVKPQQFGFTIRKPIR